MSNTQYYTEGLLFKVFCTDTVTLLRCIINLFKAACRYFVINNKELYIFREPHSSNVVSSSRFKTSYSHLEGDDFQLLLVCSFALLEQLSNVYSHFD